MRVEKFTNQEIEALSLGQHRLERRTRLELLR
jgi:hypothetical protein